MAAAIDSGASMKVSMGRASATPVLKIAAGVVVLATRRCSTPSWHPALSRR
jgi:hypothetical protein